MSPPPIIFRPLVERLDDGTAGRPVLRADRVRRQYAPLAMTDHGDHVEWTDGSGQWQWRLPDQADGPDGLPVLSSVLLAGFRSQLTGQVGAYWVRFLDPDGATIGRFTPPKGRYIIKTILGRLLPPEAYAQLSGRGVTVVEETFSSANQYFKAHPDPQWTGIERRFLTNPLPWIFAGLLLILTVASLIRFA